MENIIEIKHLTKIIKGQVILNDINLMLEAGKIHGFIGRNGSGKTMLFKAICGFIKPTMGWINVEGNQIGSDIDFPQNTGIMIENPSFILEYSAFKNLKLLSEINNIIKDQDICNILVRVGLDPQTHQKIRTFSLGMKQRLAFAQAIMEYPDILILDEPMNSLDKDGILTARNIIKEMREKGTTVLICSHINDDIYDLCDQIYVLEQGKIFHAQDNERRLK